MANMFDYMAWRGDLSFAVSPFNEVDNLIYSMLSVMNYEGIVPSAPLDGPIKIADCYKLYKERYPRGEYLGQIFPEQTARILQVAAASPRFADSYMTAFRAETDESQISQFAAVTFILPDDSLFVSFRGTDDTLVGWREDFNLSFMHPVPAQSKAVAYLEEIASLYRGKIRVGGHSKGGNLAVYAAVFAPPEVQDRILVAYSNDGPGFMEEIVESPGFKAMEPRLYTIVPQSSVIGMLLEHKEDYQVIESTVGNGLFQHDPFSWTVMGPGFVHLDALSEKGKRHDRVISQWLKGCSAEERQKFTETLFHLLESTGARTLSDLTVDSLGKIREGVRAYSELDRESKEQMTLLIRRLAEANRKRDPKK